MPLRLNREFGENPKLFPQLYSADEMNDTTVYDCKWEGFKVT